MHLCFNNCLTTFYLGDERVQTKNAVGNLISRYRAVLRKCSIMNAFGSLAIAGMCVLGAVSIATAANETSWSGSNSNMLYNNTLPVIIDSGGSIKSLTINTEDYTGGYDTPTTTNGTVTLADSSNNSAIASTLTIKSVQFHIAQGGKTLTVKGDTILNHATDANLAVLNTGKALYEGNDIDVKNGTIALTSQGTLNATNNLTVNNGTFDNSSGGIVNVAKDLYAHGGVVKSGKLTLGTATTGTTSLGGETVFFGSSWIEGSEYQNAHTASTAAFAQFEATGIDGHIIVGQNSQVALGTADTGKVASIISAMGTDKWGSAGYTAALGIFEAQTLASDGSIKVDGSLTSGEGGGSANSAKFGANSLLIVDVNAIGQSGAALTASSGELNVAADASLHIAGGTTGKYTIVNGFDGFSSGGKITEGGWGHTLASGAGANISTTSDLLQVIDTTWDADKGSLTVELNRLDAITVFTDLTTNMAGLVDKVGTKSFAANSDNRGIAFISRATDKNYLGSTNHRSAASTIEGAAQMAGVGAVAGNTLMAVNAFSKSIIARSSLTQATFQKEQIVAMGSNVIQPAAANDKLGMGVWAMPLYGSSSVDGMKSGNFENGYSSDLGGMAIGADYAVNNMFTLGLSFNIGTGSSDSDGDFNRTNNDFDFWGVSAYSVMRNNNFALLADLGYTSNSSDLTQHLPGGMQMGALTGDVDSSIITAGVRAEYAFNLPSLDIIPHAGVRFMNIATDDYTVSDGVGQIFSVETENQQLLTFPVGVTLGKTSVTDGGWGFRPQVGLGFTVAAGDLDLDTRSHIANVGSADLTMEVVDALSFDGGIGFELGKGNVSFDINYDIQLSDNKTGHLISGAFRYEF